MKRKKVLTGCMIVAVMLIISSYLGIALFYTDGFTFGTWINGIYCTGKSVGEVNRELISQTTYEQILVWYDSDYKEVLKFPEEMIELDYSDQLNRIFMQQNPFLWYRNIMAHNEEGLRGGYSISPSITVKEDLLRQRMDQLTGVKAERARNKSVRFFLDDDAGYVFQNNKMHILDETRLFEQLLFAIQSQQDAISLEETACYYDEPLSEKEKETADTAQRLFDFLDFTITYDMGDSEVVYDGAVMSHWIATGENDLDFVLDENRNFTWNMEQVDQAVVELADLYDSYGKPHTFQSTRGDLITLENGTYGNELDQKAETAFLEQVVQERKDVLRQPEYLRKAWAQGLNDIGDTYIEIDITQQKMYFYQNGECMIDTPVVTGNMMRKRETPEGVFYIYLKQKNRVLRGPGYASHVDFWMPVKNGIGIHDALWRDEFGGEIYKTEGSHGCINTPHDVMEKLYDMAEIGMPVVIFY